MQEVHPLPIVWIDDTVVSVSRFCHDIPAIEMGGHSVAIHNVLAIRQMRTTRSMAYSLQGKHRHGIHYIWVLYRCVLRCCFTD